MSEVSESDTSDTPYRILQAGDTYDVKCNICDWEALDCDDLESSGHLGDLHVGDEHFDV